MTFLEIIDTMVIFILITNNLPVAFNLLILGYRRFSLYSEIYICYLNAYTGTWLLCLKIATRSRRIPQDLALRKTT